MYIIANELQFWYSVPIINQTTILLKSAVYICKEIRVRQYIITNSGYSLC